ncbi:MAG TPA: plastocyanin/azurin family copper-binding protein [Longimicrobiaceae bacterium]|nr:plastocyanin/azurin family copper-binding protein [Longimicrobiaceae bacterium]
MRKQTTLAVLAGAMAFAPLALRPAAAEAGTPPVVHEVKMRMEGTNARFEPANLTIRSGDRIRFVNVSGGPHNVSFDPAKMPDDVERVLARSMANQIQPLWGELVSAPNAAYVVSFAGVRAGRYEFFCLPHVGMRMTGTITVQ